ncbi:hypothetical protein BB559_006686 [Furculomyces boomerangus]|uniref:B-related factor 1 n=1 Tax=Furculomyces boomerangus TaxID=61424 RepID=A0A2T9Y1A4_9FUNG|nr:hypothetical protein BB559_006686 [Furculomyces boomerangus]
MRCSGCGGNNIEHDSASGSSFCATCGLVVEESNIVSEITFSENSAGATILSGSMVMEGQTRAGGKGVGRYATSRASKEYTLFLAKQRIQALSTALSLSSHYVDSALRYYHLALNQNFTKGRKKNSVVASCLYLVCRMEKSPQMLIDFSDLIQINIFKLGVTFVRLVRVLNLVIPLIDPSLYIYRFSAMLDFGDKTQTVALDALRLVQRMDRDWIQTGRRPSGICGACLLIASRMHNFRRTERDIMEVVKIGSSTLKKRLVEFKKTPTSQLSVADFRNVWLEKAADPPAFTSNRLKSKRLVKQNALKKSVNNLKHKQMQDDLDLDNFDVADYLISNFKSRSTKKSTDNGIIDELYNTELEDTVEKLAGDENEIKQANPLPLEKEVVFKILENERKRYQSIETLDTFDTDVSKWADLDDAEIESFLLEQHEIEIKTEIWTSANKEYLQLQALKKAKSTKNMLVHKKLSKKINYNILDSLFDIDVQRPKVEPGKGIVFENINHQLNLDSQLSTTKSAISNELLFHADTETKEVNILHSDIKTKQIINSSSNLKRKNSSDLFDEEKTNKSETDLQLLKKSEHELEILEEIEDARYALGYGEVEDYGDGYDEYE